MHVPIEDRIPAANLAVEALEDLSGPPDFRGGSDEPNLVAACTDIDAQLLLDDSQGPVALTEEC
jgi:hypothetical protein